MLFYEKKTLKRKTFYIYGVDNIVDWRRAEAQELSYSTQDRSIWRQETNSNKKNIDVTTSRLLLIFPEISGNFQKY